ncbi:hypothetical protein B0J11DRAFT_311572 [Dendryphion nanum]|uniref:Uncharacterized protein n=1 Tax=Dendryphion nanum TaxID=256645 RepID=A0A9P9DV77_9PLEO|nr:hypothetical protein B0J11DRAFT_311572 [Dendryphion nanum]
MSLVSFFFFLFVFFACFSPSSAGREPVSCAKLGYKGDVLCEPPLDSVTELKSAVSYIAKVPCPNCPFLKETSDGAGEIIQSKNDLLYNISLSHDRTALLLEHEAIFPNLARSSFKIPPRIMLTQVSPDFARSDLNASVDCIDQNGLDMPRSHPYYLCIHPRLSVVSVDYDFSAKQISEKDDVIRWEITFDAIGGLNGITHEPTWVFNGTAQKMVKVALSGKRIEQEGNQRDPQTGSTLFGGSVDSGQETKYNMTILDVKLVDRVYDFPVPLALTFWSKVRHFFGSDPKPAQNHLVYRQNDWDSYGKKGTLRNAFGNFIHETEWTLIFVIVGGVVGGILALYAVYRLCLVLIEQRRLAQWGGMDEVWRQMRAGGGEEDDGLLFDERYRDYPDGSQSPPPSYTDEVQVNKPLPSKPLPDKPLPAVPLIEEV